MQEWVGLIEGATRGVSSAQAELYRAFRPNVSRLASGFAQLDPDEVEDVVQETFIRAFRELPRLREPAAFPGWLLSIARNRCRNRLDHRSFVTRLVSRVAAETPPELPHFPPALQAEREEAVVRELIDALPDGPEKETVTLFYVEGELSAREIADKLGVGKSTVTMRLERFRGRVKRDLLRRVLATRRD